MHCEFYPVRGIREASFYFGRWNAHSKLSHVRGNLYCKCLSRPKEVVLQVFIVMELSWAILGPFSGENFMSWSAATAGPDLLVWSCRVGGPTKDFWSLLGAILGARSRHLGLVWAILGSSWAILGPSDGFLESSFVPINHYGLRVPPKATWGRSWSHLGLFWGVRAVANPLRGNTSRNNPDFLRKSGF